MRYVYLDHAATTPLDPRVLSVMLPFLEDSYGNASSVHALGRKARFTVEECRECIAEQLGASPGEIIFTSGGTESNNMALKGTLMNRQGQLVTSTTEHEAILRPAETLRKMGREVAFLSPENSGTVSPQQIDAVISDETRMVSLMHANNETGALTNLPEIAKMLQERGVFFHSDAVQTAGFYRLRVDELGVDALSFSAHKFYGPKGTGVLFLRNGIDLMPLVEGGAQERRRRGGTENVAGIVGMTEALDIAVREAGERIDRIRALRDRLYTGLHQALEHPFVVNTPMAENASAPHILNIAFPPVDRRPLDGEMLLLNLDLEGVLVSAGSACTSGALEPSHVLLAIGLDRATASAAIRFSLGKDNTEEHIDFAVDRLSKVLQRMTRT